MLDGLPPEPPFPPIAPNLIVDASALREQLGRVTVIDCRRKAAFDDATQIIQGAVWRDPETVLDWIGTVPRDRPVVAYCKYGHEVSLFVAGTLRARGYDVRSLQGGIAAWMRENGPTQRKDVP